MTFCSQVLPAYSERLAPRQHFKAFQSIDKRILKIFKGILRLKKDPQRGHHDMVLLREMARPGDTTAAAQGAESHGAGTRAGVYERPGVLETKAKNRNKRPFQ